MFIYTLVYHVVYSLFLLMPLYFFIVLYEILDIPWRCSASGMYATYGIYNLEAIIRKQTFGFIGRLRKSCNTIVQTLENAWIIRIQLWHTWCEVLYTNR